MEESKDNDKILLPHHKQQPLCTTRPAYRQGRKLTATKAYSITNESNHLLIFGVPSLNLSKETRSHFARFGGLVQFEVSKCYFSEPFTETYHAQYDRTQPARLAKRMNDMKNFYGGSLHVCYAPELETVDETRQKLMQRQRDIIFRMKSLQKELKVEPKVLSSDDNNLEKETKKLNMGELNTISIGKQIREVCKKKNNKQASNKRFKPLIDEGSNAQNSEIGHQQENPSSLSKLLGNSQDEEIIDCTHVETEIVSNIEESLNYNRFGSEIIRKIPEKPINKICFHSNKNP